MTDYWITIRVDPQRTADIRVSGESYDEIAEKWKEKDGCPVVMIRPCEREQAEAE